MKTLLLILILSLVSLSSQCQIRKHTGKFDYKLIDTLEMQVDITECGNCFMDPDYEKVIKIKYKNREIIHVVELSQERDLGVQIGKSKLNSGLSKDGVESVVVIRDFYEGCRIIDLERNENISDKYLPNISQYECDSLFSEISNQINFELNIFFDGKNFSKYSGDFIEEKKKNGTF